MQTPNNTLTRVRAALAKNGYGSDLLPDIRSASFVGWNDSGIEVHQISWRDDNRVETGRVFIDPTTGHGEF